MRPKAQPDGETEGIPVALRSPLRTPSAQCERHGGDEADRIELMRAGVAGGTAYQGLRRQPIVARRTV